MVPNLFNLQEVPNVFAHSTATPPSTPPAPPLALLHPLRLLRSTCGPLPLIHSLRSHGSLALPRPFPFSTRSSGCALLTRSVRSHGIAPTDPTLSEPHHERTTSHAGCHDDPDPVSHTCGSHALLVFHVVVCHVRLPRLPCDGARAQRRKAVPTGDAKKNTRVCRVGVQRH